MITEDYVSFEIAKLLKEKGFEGVCHAVYDKDGILFINLLQFVGNSNFKCVNEEKVTFAPTLQMAMKWLLKTHSLLITTFSSSQESWMYRITKPHQRLEDGVYGEDYETREDAIEAAIKYCLENLVP